MKTASSRSRRAPATSQRTKIAVWSNDPNIDPVGTCVGPRVQGAPGGQHELRGEKIPTSCRSPMSGIEFVAKALQPARVREVRIHRDLGTAEVIVPTSSRAWPSVKEGQNARLAHASPACARHPIRDRDGHEHTAPWGVR
ncbi:MAG: hypothetical protein IPI82_15635 [Candidatus Microthrix sp.]|nr:hypothetical protein [Candidatus Microthrix sp.]MBK7323824.1 hypothetical protein [Candidatus Microthrix sp.]